MMGDGARRQRADARGRELNGQWDAFQALADSRDDGLVLRRQLEARVDGAGAFDEELDRIGRCALRVQ